MCAMDRIYYHSTNNYEERVDFETALLNGIASNYGLYMFRKEDIPRIPEEKIKEMRYMSYSEIAYEVLRPFLAWDIPEGDLKRILDDAYDEKKIPTKIQHVLGGTYILWLSFGPTSSFKDYAARFYARALQYFLVRRKRRKIVVVATSGDTGGAIADALYGLENLDCVVLYPRERISEGQRRQMTTLLGNIYAFEVNGDFDICQALAKEILSDKDYAKESFGDRDIFTSANSISIGRLLPQAVYPFFGYSRMEDGGFGFYASVPSGNFGNMMGTVIAMKMGLPVRKVICALNENTEFLDFLRTGKYVVRPTKVCPSSAMNVSHPSNLARLFDLYGGRIYDLRDEVTKEVKERGVVERMPDLETLRRDIEAISVSNEEHYETIREVYEKFGVLLDPHGACGWRAYEKFSGFKYDSPALIYETADPGKFPDVIKRALGFEPEIPDSIRMRMNLEERIFRIESPPLVTETGYNVSKSQVEELKRKIREVIAA